MDMSGQLGRRVRQVLIDIGHVGGNAEWELYPPRRPSFLSHEMNEVVNKSSLVPADLHKVLAVALLEEFGKNKISVPLVELVDAGVSGEVPKVRCLGVLAGWEMMCMCPGIR